MVRAVFTGFHWHFGQSLITFLFFCIKHTFLGLVKICRFFSCQVFELIKIFVFLDLLTKDGNLTIFIIFFSVYFIFGGRENRNFQLTKKKKQKNSNKKQRKIAENSLNNFNRSFSNHHDNKFFYLILFMSKEFQFNFSSDVCHARSLLLTLFQTGRTIFC